MNYLRAGKAKSMGGHLLDYSLSRNPFDICSLEHYRLLDAEQKEIQKAEFGSAFPKRLLEENK